MLIVVCIWCKISPFFPHPMFPTPMHLFLCDRFGCDSFGCGHQHQHQSPILIVHHPCLLYITHPYCTSPILIVHHPCLLYVSESAVPNNSKVCPHSRVLFRCNHFDLSSVFWLFFQANRIIINHTHRPSLAKSEW